MCGIAGVINFSKKIEDAESREIRDLLRLMKHRGPDHSGVVGIGDTVLLGSNRLCITDPTNSKANMPIFSNDGRLALIFNGEIYNHMELRRELSEYDFRTRCDTETVLAAYEKWGSGCLDRFEGMFAFCLYDIPRRLFLMPVDMAGQKPLYYYQDSDSLVFSSEIEPLIRNRTRRKSWDVDGLAESIVRRFTIGGDTHIKEIKKVPSGHALILADGQLRVNRYYTIPIGDQERTDVERIAEELYEAFHASCRNTFNLEVPCGLLLSGGIDSTSVLAEAAVQGVPLHTYSIGFEPMEGPNYEKTFGADEFGFSRPVARHFGSQHHEIRISQAEYFRYFRRWADSMGEPMCFNDAPALLRLFEEARLDCRVVLCGSGPDEMFDGYYHFNGITYGAHVENMAAHDPYMTPEHYFDVDTRLYGCDLSQLMPGRNARPRIVEKMRYDLEPYWQSVKSPQQLTQLTMLHGRQVAYEYTQLDRTSMLNSVEARIPYAERRMMAAAFNFHPKLKFHNNTEKWIQKQMLKNRVPDFIVERKKAAFPMPTQYFFAEEYENMLKPVMEEGSALLRTGLVDGTYLRQLWNSPDPNDRPVFSRIFMLNRLLENQREFVSG